MILQNISSIKSALHLTEFKPLLLWGSKGLTWKSFVSIEWLQILILPRFLVMWHLFLIFSLRRQVKHDYPHLTDVNTEAVSRAETWAI